MRACRPASSWRPRWSGAARSTGRCRPWWPRSDLNRSILSIYAIITWVSAIIAVVVFTALGLILLRFREQPGAAGLPRQIRGHTALEIAWTIAPALSCSSSRFRPSR